MKYKLIKTYPGFEELNQITWFGPNNMLNPEKYPEFWEKVVEKDYEILSFLTETDVILIPKIESFKFFVPKDFAWDGNRHRTEEFMLRNPNTYKIHSVKRLSDGEIFIIGDIIDTRVDNKYKKEILEINIVNNEIRFKTKSGFVVLHVAVKTKQKLFTTEDGIDIFEGDTYYELITPDFHNKPCIWNILPNKTRGNINYDQEGNRRNGRIWFSTKEKAEEYILLNTPCLSYGDIQPYLKVKDCNKVLQLVQSKF